VNSFDIGDTVYYLKLCPETKEIEILSGKVDRIIAEHDSKRLFISKKRIWLDVHFDCILYENAYKTKEDCILGAIDKLQGMLEK
jgi:hypothetical protein